MREDLRRLKFIACVVFFITNLFVFCIDLQIKEVYGARFALIMMGVCLVGAAANRIQSGPRPKNHVDRWAEGYGLTRKALESDEALRARTREAARAQRPG